MENNPYSVPSSLKEQTEDSEKLLTPLQKQILTIYLDLQEKKPTIWYMLKVSRKAYFLILLYFCFLIALGYLFDVGDFMLGIVVGFFITNMSSLSKFSQSWSLLKQILAFDKIKEILEKGRLN